MFRKMIVLVILVIAFLGINAAFIDTLSKNTPPQKTDTGTALTDTEQTNAEKTETPVQQPPIQQKPEKKQPTTLLEMKLQECDKEELISSRDACILSLMPLSDSISLCNSVQSSKNRYRCVTDYAIRKADYGVCDSLGVEFGTETLYLQDLPYSRLCKDEIAYANNDIGRCTTNNCLYMFAQKTKNKDVCALIKMQEIKDQCIAAVS